MKAWLVCLWRIRHQPVALLLSLQGLASSSEDEDDSRVVREECGAQRG